MKNLHLLMLDTLIKDFPGYIFWKDKELSYQGGNDKFVQAIGAESIHDILNKTDYDLPWKETAEQYRNTDLKVLAGEKIVNKHEVRYYEGGIRKVTLVNKLPLRDEDGSIIGILGLHQEMFVDKACRNTDNKEIDTDICVKANYLEKDVLIAIIKDVNHQLTDKEIICLSLWLSGFSIKESSYYMNISNKSIEAYRTSIKNKLKVNYNNQLIDLIHKTDTYNLLLDLGRTITKRR